MYGQGGGGFDGGTQSQYGPPPFAHPGRRLAGALVDSMIMLVVSTVLMVALALIVDGAGHQGFWNTNEGGLILVFLPYAFVIFTYMTVLCPLGGTLGHRACGMRIVDSRTGDALSWTGAAIRGAVFACVPIITVLIPVLFIFAALFYVVSVGYILAPPRYQGLHDRMGHAAFIPSHVNGPSVVTAAAQSSLLTSAYGGAPVLQDPHPAFAPPPPGAPQIPLPPAMPAAYAQPYAQPYGQMAPPPATVPPGLAPAPAWLLGTLPPPVHPDAGGFYLPPTPAPLVPQVPMLSPLSPQTGGFDPESLAPPPLVTPISLPEEDVLTTSSTPEAPFDPADTGPSTNL